MLSRANRAYEARPAASPARNDLSKQLFPSSSPSNNHDASIVDSFNKSRQPKLASGVVSVPARNAAFASVNPRTSSVTSFGAKQSGPPSHPQGSTMASLYAKSDSFSEVSDDPVTQAPSSKAAPPVFFNEDDFSDDDNLDLDYEKPSALPSLPKPASPKPLREAHNPPAPPSTLPEVGIPWSSSPASHMQPPPLPREATLSRSVSNPVASKRRSQEDFEVPQAKQSKRRNLPQSFKREESIKVEDDQEEETFVPCRAPGDVTPAPRKKDSLPWNTTASAVKEQKKHLKTQSKKPMDAEPRMDGIHQPVVVQPPPRSNGISLSKEQQRVQSLVVDKGQSVFFTGPAGTGKSVLMRSIIAAMKKKFSRDPERLAVTASTGLAACNIGGITLHSFSGIGLGKEDVPTLVKKIRRNPKAKNRWLRTKVLVVDEISMVDGDLFDKLSQIGRTIRNNGRPWGGIQLVITGDFFQLPPVPDYGDNKKRESKFAFDATTWNTSIDHTIGLTQVFRQKDPGKSPTGRHLCRSCGR